MKKKDEKLEKYFDIEALKALFAKHSKKMKGVWLSLYDLDETIHIDMDVNDICHVFHRVNPKTADLCSVCNKELIKKFYNLEYAEYKCGNGLLNITMPIKIEGKHVATFSTGQFFIEGEVEPEIDLFKKRAKEFGFKEVDYIKMYKKMPTLTRKQVNNYLTKIRAEILALAKK